MLETRLVGARLHNLKGVSLDVRPGEVLAITGISGAGKSSLAFDTLYAEGQRRFVESFSPYARQFLERLERPPVDLLAPVGAGVAVDRSAPVKSSRSTLATMADLEPYLAALFSTESIAHCPEHARPGVELGLDGTVRRVLERFAGRVALPTFFRAVPSKDEYLPIREALVRDGHRRVIVDGDVTTLDELKPSRAVKAGGLFVVLDRVTVNPSARARLAEALETAFRNTGEARVFSDGEELRLVPGLACPECARRLDAPKPGYFSYESALGACDACKGFGRTIGIDYAKVIPDSRLSLKKGAVRAWRGDSAAWERRQLEKWAAHHGIPMDVPWSGLTDEQRHLVLHGKSKKGEPEFWGVSHWFTWLETKTYKMHVRVFLSRFRSYDPCAKCGGTRLGERSRGFLLAGHDLGGFHRLSVTAALEALGRLAPATPHGEMVRKELATRLIYLEKVGLGYLTLDRSARTLSGGEAQRVTLTAALGTSLHHALFVLDEPSVGLHPSDIAPLGELIRQLAARDNAVLLIEHEPLLVGIADRVVELGPGAGERGGSVLYDGPLAGALEFDGATKRALEQPLVVHVPQTKPRAKLVVRGASENNLRNVDFELPLGKLVYLAGPSGSGKSTLGVDVLYRSLAKHFGDGDVEAPGRHADLVGVEHLTEVELVDQAPLGRTSRGNPATYTKAWDHVRKLFASEPAAVLGGFGPGSFSFNVAGGRCDACNGEGYETVEMQFLADVALLCAECGGKRFKAPVLNVRHRGLDVSEVLNLTVAEALELFREVAAIRRALGPLLTLGLGYLRLGQPLSTLSGGEAQRLKVARALAEPKPGKLFVLDEPSAGLHADEVKLLIEALRMLVRGGASVLVIDHDLLLLADFEHVVELGPGGGEAGGSIVFEGTPEALVRAKTKTGEALRRKFVLPKRSRATRDRRPAGLSVRGAREHTLKNVDVEIPHEKLTVVTGPSGSGKSTLAFDVVFAEGQRRFLETLTPYARRFLPTLPRPHVDLVDGVPPSIALEQRTTRIGTRSTVATVTEVAHYLRLGFAKLGAMRCPTHDLEIHRQSRDELFERLRSRGGRAALLAPVVRGRKGTYGEVFEQAARARVAYAIADGVRVSTETPPRLAKTKEHTISLVLEEGIELGTLGRDTFERALALGGGHLELRVGSEVAIHSLQGGCPECGYSAGDVDPRYFSFNTVQGQCKTCEGVGFLVDETKARKAEAVRRICPECAGTRLSAFSRKVRFLGRTYAETTALSVRELHRELGRAKVPPDREAVYRPIFDEIERRLGFLDEVGLGYLSLDRDAATLSGGELQRLRLAAQLGAGLTGALYVLDEPTIGLHPRDTGRLLENLRKLVATGSSVLLVEHDEDVIRAADHLIDMGPEGGRGGGSVVTAGPPKKVLAERRSPTARALAERQPGRLVRPVKGVPRLGLFGAKAQNLRGDAVEFPLGRMTTVVGVSGSGKSTLVRGVLLPALREKLERKTAPAGSHERLVGWEPLRRAISVDQSPIGRTPRSVPATFLGIWDDIRALFAKSPDAQVRGFSAARFSFNGAGGGRCPTCEGQGSISHEMSFLPDAITSCPSCEGLRFEERTLEVRYLGKSIGEVLRLSASEALEVFAAHPRITRPLRVLDDLGAGYIALGQGSHTLSGGEAQRLKLASELSAGSKHEPTLYVLDEPTTGLHVADVERLTRVLDQLVERGDTLVVIEHHPDVVRCSDFLVEMGPEGGPEGGRVVFMGTPSELLKKKTATALALRTGDFPLG